MPDSHRGVSQSQANIFRKQLLRWSQDKIRSFPWRETDNPFEILIAEFLLQRTPAERVEPIYKKIIDRHPSFESLSHASLAEIKELLRPLGLHNKRGEAIQEIAIRLADGQFPQSEAELVNLPYIGRYGANAILCFAFDEPVAILDQNVIRIYNRLFGLNLDHRAEQSWVFAEWMLPKSDIRRYNLALLDFGALVCLPRSPRCNDCFANNFCKFFQQQTTNQ